MPRTPYAARQLIREVSNIDADAQAIAQDEDGLRIFRTIAFDSDTAAWLEPAMQIVKKGDPRIVAVERHPDTDELLVKFANISFHADTTHSFNLAKVKSVLDAKAEVAPEPEAKPKRKPRKSAAANLPENGRLEDEGN